MQPTKNATLTAVGTDLYAPGAGGTIERSGTANSRIEQHSVLNLLASKKEHIDQNVLVPILESSDVSATFADKRAEYHDWRNAWVSAVADKATNQDLDLNGVLAMDDAQDERLKRLFNGSQDQLGESAVRALVGAVSLKKIVRHATMPHSGGWSEESWRHIVHLFASCELCMIGVLHHLATGIGRGENVKILADWSFIYAAEAYDEAGYFGPDAPSLEGK